MKKIITIITFFSVLNGCNKNVISEPKIIINKSLASDFNIPSDLFKTIKAKLGEDVKADPEYLFTNLEVRLFSDQKNVLTYPNLLFKLPNGGGEIDLKDHVTGHGSFYLSFPSEQFGDKPELEFLFYISNSPKVSLRGEEFGLGCGQWVDLAPQISNLKNITYLKLNTADQAYTHVVSGQYIFVFKQGMRYFITHLNLYDSRYLDKVCTEIFKITK